MATTIKLDRRHHESLESIEQWCREKIGLGSRRFVKNTWLGMEDWFYYEQRLEEEVEFTAEEVEQGLHQHVCDVDDTDSDLIFVFRRDSDASLFSLKWQ